MSGGKARLLAVALGVGIALTASLGPAAAMGRWAGEFAAPWSASGPAEDVDRVLIVSLPGVGWADVQQAESRMGSAAPQGSTMPTLLEFVSSAAIGGVPPSIGQTEDSTIEAYMTFGSGTRAVAPLSEKAVALDPDETYHGVSATDLFERRLGFSPDGVAYLPVGAAARVNEKSEFGAETGMLGEALDDAGIRRAVIANSDAIEGLTTDEPLPDGALARGAATAIMDADGTVPEGSVGRSLLMDDPDAPFGVRLDHDAVLAEFDAAWTASGSSVVLVEASDLSRAAAYRPLATPSQRAAFREAALIDADRLLGELLERVDPETDAVIVLSPVSAPGLGIATVGAPGVEPALLRSATTRRDGYIQLADFAPTVLSLLGEDVSDDIEGRPLDITGTAGGVERIERLEHDAAAAERHDALLPLIFGLAAAGVAVLLVAMWLGGRLTWLRRIMRPVAFGVLGFVPATFLVGGIDALAGSKAGYVITVIGLALGIGLALWAVDRARPGKGALAGVAVIAVLIAGDLLTGAHLQVNTAFGYSLAVAGRFVGLGNLAFALLGSAAIVLAALLVDRFGHRGLKLAVGLLAALVLIIGLPMIGADVGGLVTTISAFGVTSLLLAGRRVRLREVVVLGVITVAAVLMVAAIDALRPEQVQTHLVRIMDPVVNGEWAVVAKTIGRRLTASFGDAEVAGWLAVGIVSLVTVVYMAVAAIGRTRLGTGLAGLPRPVRAAAAGLLVMAVLGVVVNDSSFAVVAVMLLVVVPVISLRPAPVKEAQP